MRNFYSAYKTIHKLAIRSSAILVYYDLCRRTNKENECWPSKQTIAKACHISVSTVTRSLRELEKAGMLLSVFRYDNKRQTSNIYKVFETPQQFTQPPEDSDLFKESQPQQQIIVPFLEEEPQNIPAACEQKASDDLPIPEIRSEAPASVLFSHPQNCTASKISAAREPVFKQEAIIKSPDAKYSNISTFMLILCFIKANYDTLVRVSVTPHGTKPEKKVMDNLRSKNIFSKITKWYKEQHRKKDACWRYHLVQNE